ncbi:MAG TPA: ATP-binding protein [Firmicutes bacterium]|nr:ATP-binding protein [Bacillota bacterium]
MIGLIYGPKGSGKTKEILRRANDALEVSKGNIVYITDTAEYTRSIPTAIRYVNAAEYLPEGGKITEEALLGFVKGVIASNSDVTEIFIDGLARMLGEGADDLEEFFVRLDGLSDRAGVQFCISLTCDKLPKFLKKFS